MEKDQEHIPDIYNLPEDLRQGPRPLPVHILAAIQSSLKNAASADQWETGLKTIVTGMRKYLNHPFRPATVKRPEVWRKGEASLLAIMPENEKAQDKKAIALVPSLINRSLILDLLPRRSLAGFLAEKGFSVYLLDWGGPVQDDGMQDLDGVLLRMVEAIEAAEDLHGQELSAFGYCMGGTLLMSAMADDSYRHRLSNIKQAVFMAAPWDFEAEPADLTRQVNLGAPAALQMIEERGYLPVNWIQSVFALVTAGKIVDKYARLATLDMNSPPAELFTAVEDWLNDGVDLPGALATACIRGWYGGNATLACIPKEPLALPALVIASRRDPLVPYGSSLALQECFASSKIISPDTGHIGMITSRRAREDVWEPMAEWLLQDRG